jgi:hypothetical protein
VAAAAERRSNGVVIGAALAGALSDALAAIAAIAQLAKILMNILILSFPGRFPSDGTGRHTIRPGVQLKHALILFVPSPTPH